MRAACLASVALATASPASAERLEYANLDASDAELSRATPAASTRGPPRLEYLLFDRFEWAPQRGRDGYAWDFSLLWGGERDGLWLSSVGEGGLWGSPEYVELQAFYARRVGSDLSLNAGAR